MENVFDLLSESDLTTDLQILSDVCGIETVKLILKNLAGLNFYVPGISRLDSLVMKFMSNHPEKTIKQIAFNLGVSEPYLKGLKKKME